MPVMYGWRAKIGLITPMGENVEHAFHIYAPDGVSFASTKFSFPGPGPEGPEILTNRLEEAAAMYRDYDVDLVVFGGNTVSCVKGLGWDQNYIPQVERAGGHPVLAASTAALEALKALGVKKVAVLTPYADITNEAEKKFLEDNGCEVTNIAGMDVGYILSNGRGLEACDEYLLYRNALRMDLAGAEAFFLSGMGLSTMEIVDELETVMGVPVVTSQQAALWGALRHCRVGAKLEKLGRLFQL